MLKIRRYLFLLLVVLAVFSYVSAQTPPSLLDELEVISVENASHLQQIAEISYATGIVRLVTWSPDGTRLAVIREGNEGRSVEIWDLSAETLPTTPALTIVPNSVDRIRWLPDSQSIVTHGQYRSDDAPHLYVVQWDANTGALLETLLDEKMIYLNGEQPRVAPILGWNRDYTQFATYVDPSTFQLSDGRTFSGDYGEYGAIFRVDWSPDEQYISVLHVTGYEVYRFVILDAESLSVVTQIQEIDDYYVNNLAWSPDSATLTVASVIAGISPRVNIRPYRIGEDVCYGNCERRLSIKFPENYNPGFIQPMGISWSPDSQMLAVSTTTTFEIFEVATLTNVASIGSEGVVQVDWQPSGKFIVTGDTDGTIRFWGVPSS